MCSAKRYVLFSLFILSANFLQAQKNITGTWEGDLGNDQFLQLNVIQNGDKLCGYTRDHVKDNQQSYCKAYFEGVYDRLLKRFIITGTSFIENSGDHTLMYLELAFRLENGAPVLVEEPSKLSLLIAKFAGDSSLLQYVYLKKVAPQPTLILEPMKDCLPKQKKIKKAPKDSIPVSKPKEIIKPKDSIITLPPPVIAKKDSIVIPKDSLSIPKLLTQRKNTELSHLQVNVKSITLNVYDNAVVDGDTVSIFYNGRLLLSHQRLSEKPIVINLQLDEGQTRHEIILFAENLGGIPPNTALIVVYAGDKRYELFSSASLEENAVLVFDYIPDK